MSGYYRNNLCITSEWLNGEPVAYHVFRIPGCGLKGGYWAIGSYNAFRRREGERHFGKNCAKTRRPTRYSMKMAYDHLFDSRCDRRIERACLAAGQKGWRHGLPIHRHASIWDFYEAIGFDHKRNRYTKAA